MTPERYCHPDQPSPTCPTCAFYEAYPDRRSEVAAAGVAAEKHRQLIAERQAKPAPTVPANRVKLPLPCIHRGEPTGEMVRCPTCRGVVNLRVFACAVHPEGTTLERRVAGKACCDGACRERVAS